VRTFSHARRWKWRSLSVTADPALSAVTTDPIRLRQIVYKLLYQSNQISPAESLVQVRAIPDEAEDFAGADVLRHTPESFRCCLTIFTDWTVPRNARDKVPG